MSSCNQRVLPQRAAWRHDTSAHSSCAQGELEPPTALLATALPSASTVLYCSVIVLTIAPAGLLRACNAAFCKSLNSKLSAGTLQGAPAVLLLWLTLSSDFRHTQPAALAAVWNCCKPEQRCNQPHQQVHYRKVSNSPLTRKLLETRSLVLDARHVHGNSACPPVPGGTCCFTGCQNRHASRTTHLQGSAFPWASTPQGPSPPRMARQSILVLP